MHFLRSPSLFFTSLMGHGIEVGVKRKANKNSDYLLFQAVPNPFSKETSILHIATTPAEEKVLYAVDFRIRVK